MAGRNGSIGRRERASKGCLGPGTPHPNPPPPRERGRRKATHPIWATALGATVLLALGLIQSRSTWRTPEEWRDATELAASIRRYVPPDALLIAPEAVIYLGDRRGCRLEWGAGSVRRAANEWRPVPPFAGENPADLVDFYRRRAGARYFADLETDPARHSLHEAIRRDPSARVVDDRPGHYLLVEFPDPD